MRSRLLYNEQLVAKGHQRSAAHTTAQRQMVTSQSKTLDENENGPGFLLDASQKAEGPVGHHMKLMCCSSSLSGPSEHF